MRYLPLLAASAATAFSIGFAQAAVLNKLEVSQQPHIGPYLTNGQDRALYLFTPDTSRTSSCYGRCSTIWPPVTASGGVALGARINRNMLGTMRRQDGTTQITYAGHPLYYYTPDQRPGSVAGQGVTSFGGTWYLVTPNGRIARAGG